MFVNYVYFFLGAMIVGLGMVQVFMKNSFRKKDLCLRYREESIPRYNNRAGVGKCIMGLGLFVYGGAEFGVLTTNVGVIGLALFFVGGIVTYRAATKLLVPINPAGSKVNKKKQNVNPYKK